LPRIDSRAKSSGKQLFAIDVMAAGDDDDDGDGVTAAALRRES
jgi:hypothetical protein